MAFVEIRTADKFKKLVGEVDPDRLLLRFKVNGRIHLADLLDYMQNPEMYNGHIPAVQAILESRQKAGGQS